MTPDNQQLQAVALIESQISETEFRHAAMLDEIAALRVHLATAVGGPLYNQHVEATIDRRQEQLVILKQQIETLHYISARLVP